LEQQKLPQTEKAKPKVGPEGGERRPENHLVHGQLQDKREKEVTADQLDNCGGGARRVAGVLWTRAREKKRLFRKKMCKGAIARGKKTEKKNKS